MDSETINSPRPSVDSESRASTDSSIMSEHRARCMALFDRKLQDACSTISARETSLYSSPTSQGCNIASRMTLLEQRLADLRSCKGLADRDPVLTRFYRHISQNIQDEIVCLSEGIVTGSGRFRDTEGGVARLRLLLGQSCPTARELPEGPRAGVDGMREDARKGSALSDDGLGRFSSTAPTSDGEEPTLDTKTLG